MLAPRRLHYSTFREFFKFPGTAIPRIRNLKIKILKLIKY